MKTIIFFLFSTLLSQVIFAQREYQNITDTINFENCTCTSYKTISKGRYIPPLSLWLKYEDFKNASDWTFKNGKEDFDKLYFIDSYSHGSSSMATLSQIIVSSYPIKLIHPQETFTINLSPFHNEPENYLYKNTLNKYHSRYFNKYNRKYEDFNYSAKAYFDYLNNRESNIHLSEFFIKEIEWWSFERIEMLITTINNKYNTNLDIHYFEKLGFDDYDGDFIGAEELANQLAEPYTLMEDIILNEFVLTDTTAHKINNEEFNTLKKVFDYRYSSIEKFNAEHIHLQYSINLSEVIGIEIDPKIIRKFDLKHKKPIQDSLNNFVPPNILIENNGLFYSYKKGVKKYQKKNILKACIENSEITGTGVLVDFKKAEIIARKIFPSRFKRKDVEEENYPLLLDSVTMKYDTLITHFSGLKMDTANLDFPFKNKYLKFNAFDIVINNNLITGRVEIPFEVLKNEKLKIFSKENTLKMSFDELKMFFSDLGFDKLQVLKKNELIEIHFLMLNL